MENKTFEAMASYAIACGAYRANVIRTDEIKTDPAFRDMCRSNACGMYGKCYMCPPDLGDIEVLMAEVGAYDYALVYQTVTELEDSYDFEGMMEAQRGLYAVTRKLRSYFARDLGLSSVLHLGAGGCGVCETCAKRTGEPCRAPALATPSLEGYGVNVSELARAAGMKYINGQDTVTYFGAVLFNGEA